MVVGDDGGVSLQEGATGVILSLAVALDGGRLADVVLLALVIIMVTIIMDIIIIVMDIIIIVITIIIDIIIVT